MKMSFVRSFEEQQTVTIISFTFKSTDKKNHLTFKNSEVILITKSKKETFEFVVFK